ncbi:MAG: hypothetical protein IJ752_04850 [Alphaproteobacteria bacterium]|nr:hypothetical protein [Alphaproteobacteria bacterium]
MKKATQQESGRSMIEMLGVLAIIGVLSVGGIAGYSQAMNKFKVSKTTDQIQTMVQNIRTLFASQKNYDGLDSATNQTMLYSSGIFSDENCPDGSSCSNPMNPYGGLIVVQTVKDDNSRSKRAFTLVYNGLPADACVRLATQGWGDASSGLIAVQAKNAAVATVESDSSIPQEASGSGNSVVYTSTGNVPMSLSKASTGCGASGNSSAVALYFK